MSNYDFKSAKRYIQMHSDIIEVAYMGMQEDWYWTAETVYEDGRFVYDLDIKDLKIGGINGSFWATPTLLVEFKDGSNEYKECYTGDAPTGQPPEWFSLGGLSSMYQDAKVNLLLEEKSNDK